MRKMDLGSFECPYCNAYIPDTIMNDENKIDSSGPFEEFDLDGFHYYNHDEYICPVCQKKFYISRRRYVY